jgi:hypothetical protein
MTVASTAATSDRTLEARYQARLDREVERLREQSHRAVEEFKRSFPPPSDEQIQHLLYPELSEFQVELGGRRFTLRELPALVEKKFLRLVEQRLPALLEELLSFEERLGDDAQRGFARLLARAATAIDLVADACLLVLDPLGEAGLTAEFVQQHASTARQVRILQAQLLLNGARDFLSRLFPVLRGPQAPEVPVLSEPQAREGPTLAAQPATIPQNAVPGPAPAPRAVQAGAAASSPTPGSPPLSVGSSSSAARPAKLGDSSPWDNSL